MIFIYKVNIMNSKLEYIKEHLGIINEMIENKRPKFEIARVLNVKYCTLDKYLKEFGINYKGNPGRKDIPHYSDRKPIEEYLGENTNVSASKLRARLIDSGLKEGKCECCGLSEWMGRKIPLELHHKNMNHYDNRIENLQILCSNCHSLAHNYSNTTGKEKTFVNYKSLEKSIGKEKTLKVKKEVLKRFCEVCGKELTSKKQKHFCSYECSHKATRKEPTIDELKNKLNELGWNKTKTGKYFGVTDTAIRKWIKKFNL